MRLCCLGGFRSCLIVVHLRRRCGADPRVSTQVKTVEKVYIEVKTRDWVE